MERSHSQTPVSRPRVGEQQRVHGAEQAFDPVVLSQVLGTLGDEGVLAAVASPRDELFWKLL